MAAALAEEYNAYIFKDHLTLLRYKKKCSQLQHIISLYLQGCQLHPHNEGHSFIIQLLRMYKKHCTD